MQRGTNKVCSQYKPQLALLFSYCLPVFENEKYTLFIGKLMLYIDI